MSSIGPKTKLMGSPLFLGHCAPRAHRGPTSVGPTGVTLFTTSGKGIKAAPWRGNYAKVASRNS